MSCQCRERLLDCVGKQGQAKASKPLITWAYENGKDVRPPSALPQLCLKHRESVDVT